MHVTLADERHYACATVIIEVKIIPFSLKSKTPELVRNGVLLFNFNFVQHAPSTTAIMDSVLIFYKQLAIFSIKTRAFTRKQY